jgi:Dolichyl-phosphate-mannose-protein mannosyltransferase
MTPRHAAAARVAGYLLLLAFFALGATSNGLHVTFTDTQTSSSRGELNSWVGSVFLLLPAALLLGYGFASSAGDRLLRAGETIRAWTPQQWRTALVAVTLVAFAAARLGRAVFLFDLPITDDEYAVAFGGRILATGHLMTRLPLLREALPDLFLYWRDGAVGSFDWPGGQAVAAIATLTRLDPWIWTLLAVVPIPALALIAARRLSRPWGMVAVALYLASPMASLLSLTAHSQLASRACLALALLAFDGADRAGGLRRWLGMGVALGLAFLCRPLETAFFCLPIAAWIVWRLVRRDRAYAAAIPGLALPVLAAVVALVAHSYGMTGTWLPARFALAANTDVMTRPLWVRFGDNAVYNLLMLAIWFLGPLGLLLVAIGVLSNAFTRLLGACVLADLALALTHDNPGLHIVGPIHYSECAVPLTIVATYGLSHLLTSARQRGFDARPIASMVMAALVVALGIFTALQAVALRDQADVQRSVYSAIESAVKADEGKAVVLTPWMLALTNAVPALRETGSWVHDWRRPQLDLSDDVLFLRDVPGGEAILKQQLPGRRFFRVQHDPRSPQLTLIPLAGGEPIVLSFLRR